MKIAVASGKGGTGKTFVATNLARVLPGAALADVDVEAANAHIFLKPDDVVTRPVTTDVPQVDASKCTHCGACVRACRFNALAAVGNAGVLVFRELCHSCGVCDAVCPAGALTMVPHEVGTLRTGRFGDRFFADGELQVGQVRSTAVIAEVKRATADEPLQIWDCSPGTSCATREALDGADFCLLVTEATRFGLSDLGLALELLGALGIPAAVVVNRDGMGGADVDAFCRERQVPIAARIPFDRQVAEWYSTGHLAVDASDVYRAMFEALGRDILAGVFNASHPSAPPVQKRPAVASAGTHITGEIALAGAGGKPSDGEPSRLVVVSGKGGTGKTTLVASLAASAGRVSLADCDVDAANLHLVVQTEGQQCEDFQSGFLAAVNADRCVGCGVCAARCRFDAIRMTPKAEVDALKCEGCGLCELVCPVGQAGDENPVTIHPALSGELMRATSGFGPFTRGRLWAGGEASGKLVSCVRQGADEAAVGADVDRVLIDGPPGTGCPVNASITGADLALVVTEPTQSGLHDMRRILDLLTFFKVPAKVVVNKADLNEDVAREIAADCVERDVEVVGHVPFDRSVVEALAEGRAATGVDSPGGVAIRGVCERVLSGWSAVR